MAENKVALKQRDAHGDGIKIKLVEGRELQIVKTANKVRQAYAIDILSLQDKSEKKIFLAWKWLILSISFIILMLLFLKPIPDYFDWSRSINIELIASAGIIGSLLCFIQFWIKTYQKQIFHSRNSHIPVIELQIGKPSKKEFSHFIKVIEKRISEFRQHMNISERSQLTGEMKMLRRLSEKGIISRENYESAKAKLFKNFDGNKIIR